MSEIRINIIDNSGVVSGTAHGFFGDNLVASLAAEPETFEELETALERFIKRESDWSPFRMFREGVNFEPYDAGLLIIDLAVRVIMVDSTYSSYSHQGTIRIKTDEGEDFGLPYELSNDWKILYSEPEYKGIARGRKEARLSVSMFDARSVLYGKPLFEFIVAEHGANKDSDDEELFTNIHAKWLMTPREDLEGKTPREVLLDKKDFIDFDLHSRSLQWSFTKECPPPIQETSYAYLYSGFGIHENVIYYDLVRFLLTECFEKDITNQEQLEPLADKWMNSQSRDFSGRIPAKLIEMERRRLNITMSAEECLIDEDCEMCQWMAIEFIDTPAFWHLDGSNMEYDRFEFSFHKNREDWEKEQREWEESSERFNRECVEGKHRDFESEDPF